LTYCKYRRLAARLLALTAVVALVLAAACSTAEPTPTAIPTRAPAVQPTSPSLNDGYLPGTPGPLKPFNLPRAGGGTLSLSSYLGKQPLNIVFYRGFF
jgi:hypothetical protein